MCFDEAPAGLARRADQSPACSRRACATHLHADPSWQGPPAPAAPAWSPSPPARTRPAAQPVRVVSADDCERRRGQLPSSPPSELAVSKPDLSCRLFACFDAHLLLPPNTHPPLSPPSRSPPWPCRSSPAPPLEPDPRVSHLAATFASSLFGDPPARQRLPSSPLAPAHRLPSISPPSLPLPIVSAHPARCPLPTSS